MKRWYRRGLALVMTGVLCMGLAACQSGNKKKQERQPETPGWRAMVPYDMGFVTVGTEGKIGAIDVDTKQATPLTSPIKGTLRDITAYNGALLAVGDDGTALLSIDGATFKSCDTGVDADLYAVTRWNDRYVAGGTEGTLLYSEDGQTWKPLKSGLEEDVITGLAASSEVCIGVTDTGRIVTSNNLTDWTLALDYNDYYQKQTTFYRIVWNGTIFSAIGHDKAEGAVVNTTLSGEVWTVRDLSFYNGEPQDVSTLTTSGACWDGDQWYVSCNNGIIYTIPDCAQCFKTEDVGGGNLTAVAYNGGKIAAVGEAYTVAVVDTEAVRQNSIASDGALAAQQRGALIIDVRDPVEFEEKHIKGALNMPMDRLETLLSAQAPDKDTQLIFYCTKGVRSQTALEKARSLGYTSVYSLGAMDKWTHEFEGAG